MYTDSIDFSMDAVDRHLYTNDCYEKLQEVYKTDIKKDMIAPGETLNYVITKYNLREKLGNI